ncbi:putative protein FAM27E1 [Macaca thibetana thibetana]|uniref:putative protein FAM27E1 n=1 Tax=Macaca thibetana thibetana TaxID=257877 RepID=UPI0021BCD2C9|nr:putative protein FAM27E1 [Macaca thibetana thibetana]
MRFPQLRGRRISSRGRGPQGPKVERRRKQLTSRHMTQAQRQKEARQSQADAQEVAFGRTGRIRPNAPTHTGTHTRTGRKRERHTQRVRARETREDGRDADTHSHTAAAAQKRSPRRHTAPLTLQAPAPRVKAPRGREQPTDRRADPWWRSRGQDFWGDSPQHRPGRPEAGTTRRFPRTPPALLSSWPARCDSRRPSGDVPVDPVER